MYPAHSQTIPVEKPISSYQNYIDQATESPHWKKQHNWHWESNNQKTPQEALLKNA